MDQTAPTLPTSDQPANSAPPPPSSAPKFQGSNILRNPKLLFALSGGVLFLLILAIIIILSPKPKKVEPSKIATTNPQQALENARKQREEASRAAQEAAKPINRLQKAYDEVVGSNSLKKKLTLDESGLATIDYVIVSNDGQVILKKSFENFAELAIRAFNINEVNKLSVSSYATKFADQYGQPNVVAVKLEINRETNNKINWPVKKFVYKDYATIVNLQEINNLLSKDYQALLRNTK